MTTTLCGCERREVSVLQWKPPNYYGSYFGWGPGVGNGFPKSKKLVNQTWFLDAIVWKIHKLSYNRVITSNCLVILSLRRYWMSLLGNTQLSFNRMITSNCLMILTLRSYPLKLCLLEDCWDNKTPFLSRWNRTSAKETEPQPSRNTSKKDPRSWKCSYHTTTLKTACETS